MFNILTTQFRVHGVNIGADLFFYLFRYFYLVKSDRKTFVVKLS